MFLVRVQGGLGNQISQYAFSRWLSARYPDAAVKLDLSWFQTWANLIGTEFEIPMAFERSRLRYQAASTEEIEAVTGQWYYKSRTRHLPDRIHNKLVRIGQSLQHSSPVILEPVVSGYPPPPVLEQLDVNQDRYFDGTWHSIDYKDLLPTLQAELYFRDNAAPSYQYWKEKIQNVFAVSFHIRKGDFSGTSWDILPQSNYYKNAVRYIEEHLAVSPTFFVFSNDHAFADAYMRSIGITHPYHVVDGRDREAYTDMLLMSLCDANICANSTFSQWGALLGWHAEKVILRPSHASAERLNRENIWGTILPL